MKKKIFVQSLFMCIIIIFLLAGYTFAEILQNDFVIITYHEQDHRIAEEILNKFSGIVTQTNREVGFYDIPVIQLVLTHSKKNLMNISHVESYPRAVLRWLFPHSQK